MIGEIKVFDDNWQDPGETEYEAWRSLSGIQLVRPRNLPTEWERIPAAAMLNICGLEPPEATKAVAAFAATIQTAEAWLAACRAIVALLGRYGNKAGPSFLFKAAMKAAEPAGGLHVSDGA